jgi:hypothetical protein
LATAKVRLAMCQVMGGVGELGGQVLHASTDALVIAVTHEAEPVFVACRGGRVTKMGTRGFLALPIGVVDELIARTGAPWKPVHGHDNAVVAYVCGTQKVALVVP